MTRVSTEYKGFGSGAAIVQMIRNFFKSRRKVAPSNVRAKSDSPTSVFISLPHFLPTGQSPAFLLEGFSNRPVYCQLPLDFHKKKRQNGRSRWFGLLKGFTPVVILIATIFAAIGMLRILVVSVSMPEYHPSAFLKTQSWRGGDGGPSPLDKMSSEYQNALTRETVAAADTGASAEPVIAKKKNPAISSKITVTGSKYKATLKSGLQNLTLKIFNGTENMLQKVTVEVDYLGRRGELVKTETFDASGLAPQQERIIEIPDGTPCTKVRYRIAEVRSKKHVTQLIHI